MKVDDPTPTYRGYRRQALYSLFRLFDDTFADGAAVQPEGIEDLGIFDKNGELAEIVQVKDHTSNLTASSFKPFFYERISQFCDVGSKVLVRVATFGPVGPDLLAAQRGDAIAKAKVIETICKDRITERKKSDGTSDKTLKPGMPAAQATRIIEHLEFHQVRESSLTERILASLNRTVGGVNPREAFDFLMWWIVTSGEQKRTIRRRDALDKLTRIGKFLEGRRAFHSEWYRSVTPLSDDGAKAAAEVRDTLKNEFFRGGRVCFDHILADVDVPRITPLTKIHQAFFESDVVVVHSASGQGKTTLAFRYLKEFAPAFFRLQLQSADGLKHAREMALAIREHSNAIAVPTLAYVDVRPGDSHWVELVRELSNEPLIRVLVTIREEDWQRSNISSADFLFAEINLDFEEPDARSIYQSLLEQHLTTNHIDFEEAWSQFGPRKSVLEFVYFVTQAETLTQRIKAQVRAFQDEVRTGKADRNEESLLRLVAVASTYEARLDLARTMKHCGIASPIETLRRFEHEYFIRGSDDGRLLDGYHAIRSRVIGECVTDPALLAWGSIAAQAIPLMDESDLEAFLLCAFSRRPDAVPELLDALDAFHAITWSGFVGVMRALMWWGLCEYWKANEDVVDEAFRTNPGAWWLMLELDIAQVLGSGSWNIFKHLGPTAEPAAALSNRLRTKLTDKATVFAPVRRWLTSRRESASQPETQLDWMSLSEAMFWCGHLAIKPQFSFSVDNDAISRAVASLPLYLVGDFIRGLREAMPTVVVGWQSSQSEAFVARLRREAAIVKLDQTDNSIVAHYLIDLDSEASRLRRTDISGETTKASIHDLTMERVNLLSQLFSAKDKYGAVGYGHRLSIFTLPVDEAEKPGVLAEYLRPHWATRFNALSRGHSEYRLRPDDWQQFFAKLTSLRCKVLLCFRDLRAAIANSRRNPGSQAILQAAREWEDCRMEFNAGLVFPKSAVDEWGYVTDSADSIDHASSQSKRQASANRFRAFLKAISEFTRTVSNFLNQARDGLVLAPLLQKAMSETQRQKIISRWTKLGGNASTLRLSVINGCDACAAVRFLHSAFEEMKSLYTWRNRDLEDRELREFLEVMNDWAEFVFPPKHHVHNEGLGRREPFGWILRPIRNRLKNNLQSLRRHNIVAKILTTETIWDGKIGLWITANVEHPVATINALTSIWNAICMAFGHNAKSPLPFCATKLAWDEIVVVLTVNNRSLSRLAFRNFKAAAFRDDPSTSGMEWAFIPQRVPQVVWEQIGIECWELPPTMSSMDQLVTSYALLVQHVEHMSDFVRIPDTDQLGLSILQEYLNRESKRAEPMLQAVYDAFAEVLNVSSSLGEFKDSPNLVAAVQALMALKDAVSPHSGSLDVGKQPVKHRVSIDEAVDWRNRLGKGLQLISLANLFWAGHLLKCREHEV